MQIMQIVTHRILQKSENSSRQNTKNKCNVTTMKKKNISINYTIKHFKT